MGTQYCCRSKGRREAVRVAAGKDGKPFLNGIDFLEVASADQKTLTVRFIHNLPGAATDPVPAAPELTADNVLVEGGVRIENVRVVSAARTADDELTVVVDRAGDFSTYLLRLVVSKEQEDFQPPRGFDPQLSEIEFSFKVECPNDFDCKPAEVCPPEPEQAPEINYLAKDYASFRQAILDRLSILMPRWRERHAADLGVALVELLAYVGDHLSYRQDAVATEAYLGTARRRVSVRRHARLVDYFMHDGANARVWVQLRVRQDVPKAQLGSGLKLLTRLPGRPTLIEPNSSAFEQALRAGAEVFETMAPVASLFKAHNEMPFYTWGERECSLPRGATRATLKGGFPNLSKGDVLVFKEARGPRTGEPEDADPAHRHAVRLTRVVTTDRDSKPLADPLNGQLITEIEWHAEDALPFPLCLSSRADRSHSRREFSDVSVALGNIVLADHGRTIAAEEALGVVPRPSLFRLKSRRAPAAPAAPPQAAGGGAMTITAEAAAADLDADETHEAVPPRFRPQLREAPLTQAAPFPYEEDAEVRRSARAATHFDRRAALPQIRLRGLFAGNSENWWPKRDLLGSDADAREFVVEVEFDGTASLRFGDGRFGYRPPSDTSFAATYRVGNGSRGNVGAGALAHLVGTLSDIERVENPLPAQGGVEPETIEEARQSAPGAFRTQERAVTPDDYGAMTSRHPGVQRAAASLRWTGSWHTVFLTVDRVGGARVDNAFEAELRRFIDVFRMAGHDTEVDNPRFVPLEIGMHVCVEPDYFASDVRAALQEVFSNRVLPDGRRGVFHPDNFSFGQTIYLSALYGAAQSVEGVASVRVTTFQRQGTPGAGALEQGELVLGRLEIARLDNDRNFPDRGVFRLVLEGGK